MRPSFDNLLISAYSPLVFLAITLGSLPACDAQSHGVNTSSAGQIKNFLKKEQRKQQVLKRIQNGLKSRHKSKFSKIRSASSWNMNHTISAANLPGHGTEFILHPPPDSLDTLEAPNKIIKPTKIERNMLSFLLGPNVIKGNGNPVSRIKLFVYVWKREPPKNTANTSLPLGPSNLVSTRDNLPERSRKGRRKNNSIKIRVFMSNKDGVKGKRIAQLKKKIYKSKFQKITLPISMIKHITEDPDNESGLMHIRVECSRCNRKTRLILPGNDNKRCRKKHRRSRKRSKSKEDTENNKENDKGKAKLKRRARRRRRMRNCAKLRLLDDNKIKKPFIMIDNHMTPDPTSRFKRAVSSPQICFTTSQLEETNIKADGKNSTSGPFTFTNDICCQKLETFINFSQLNLESQIVSPSGFYYSTCVTTCTKDIKSHQDLEFELIKNTLSHRINSILSSHSLSTRRVDPVQTSPTQQLGKIADILKRSRLKEEHSPLVQSSHTVHCSPSSTTDLTLLHFNKDSKLVQTIIPDLIISQCQCNKSTL